MPIYKKGMYETRASHLYCSVSVSCVLLISSARLFIPGYPINANFIVSLCRIFRSDCIFGCNLFWLAVLTVTLCTTTLLSGWTAITQARGYWKRAVEWSVIRYPPFLLYFYLLFRGGGRWLWQIFMFVMFLLIFYLT